MSCTSKCTNSCGAVAEDINYNILLHVIYILHIVVHNRGAAVVINIPVDDHDDDRARLHATTNDSKCLRKSVRAVIRNTAKGCNTTIT
jgi:hypothetical protein